MSKIQTKRNMPTIPAPILKRRGNATAALAPVQSAPTQRRQTGRGAEAARVSPTIGAQAAASPRPSKQAMIATMLRQRDGAAITDLMTATGWQSHSVRAALTGLRKAGHQIERHRDTAGVTRYHLAAG